MKPTGSIARALATFLHSLGQKRTFREEKIYLPHFVRKRFEVTDRPSYAETIIG